MPDQHTQSVLGTRSANVGYHMNGNVILLKGLSLTAISAPANLYFMRESGKGYVFNRAYLRPFPGACDDVYAYEQSSSLLYMPHILGFNIPFCDGHAKWYKSSQTFHLAMSHRTIRTATTNIPARPIAIPDPGPSS